MTGGENRKRVGERRSRNEKSMEWQGKINEAGRSKGVIKRNY